MLDAQGHPRYDANGQPMFKKDSEDGSWVDGKWAADQSESDDEGQSSENEDEEDVRPMLCPHVCDADDRPRTSNLTTRTA
jgi:hypothetical protein